MKHKLDTSKQEVACQAMNEIKYLLGYPKTIIHPSQVESLQSIGIDVSESEQYLVVDRTPET